jgi:hypothetical protein
MNILEKALINTVNNKPVEKMPVEKELEKSIRGILDDIKYNSINRQRQEEIIAKVLDNLYW